MQILDLNLIPQLISQKKLSQNQALHLLAVFIKENYPVFNLHQFDEDFLSELITVFLEKGVDFLNFYTNAEGSFFSYFYTYIKCIKRSLIRRLSEKRMNEKVALEQSIDGYIKEAPDFTEIIEENDFIKLFSDEKYKNNDNLHDMTKRKKKYFSSDFSFLGESDRLKTLKKLHPKSFEKILIILALKSANNISEKQILQICKICRIEKEDLQNSINKIQSTMKKRIERKRSMEEKRNAAYFRHKKCIHQLESLNNSSSPNINYHLDLVKEKYKRQTSYWKNMNQRISDGHINLRPTNKIVAETLGICERQVNYYLKTLRELEQSEKE